MRINSFHFAPLDHRLSGGNFLSTTQYSKRQIPSGSLAAPQLVSPPTEYSINVDVQVWFRVSQLAKKHQQFTENAIRAQIFGAKPRLSAKSKDGDLWISGNGLAPAIRKCGRTVLINEPMYAKWIATGSCGEGEN